MTPGRPFPFHSHASATLRAQLEQLGVIIIQCDPARRELRTYTDETGSPHRLLAHSHRFCDALWESAENLESPREIIPGFWAALLPSVGILNSPFRPLAIIPTYNALSGTELQMLCAECSLPFDAMRRQLAALPPASPLEVPRLYAMARLACEQHHAWVEEHRLALGTNIDLEEVGDERDFLYRLVRTISGHHEPRQFTLVMCNELAAALPYRRVFIQFGEHQRQLHALEGQFIAAGGGRLLQRTCGAAAIALQRATRRGVPWIATPETVDDFTPFASLGNELVIQPILDSHAPETIIGIMVAADRIGSSTENASALAVDLKLLGAASAHLSLYLANAGLDADINCMFVGALEAITSSIDAKDRMTCGHSQRVSELTRMLSRAIGFDEESSNRHHVAGLVHDVGKIGIPESVLAKPGKLDDSEFKMIRQHPEIGHQILRDIPRLDDILPGVLHHHERWDGNGYPHGLRHEEIPLIARVIALADSFDAMSCTRSYRPSLQRHEVLDEIHTHAGTQFDPELADTFLKLDFDEFDDLIHEQQISEAA